VAHKKQSLELFAVSLPNLRQCKKVAAIILQSVFVVEMSQVFDSAINIL